jgi:putative spermidine/putrescine transport system substrate-binding protein
MKRFLCYAAFLLSASIPAHADVAVMSWGGNYGEAQVTAFNRPFSQKTGIKTTMVTADHPATLVKAMVQAHNVTVDVVEFEYADAIRGCDEGMLETIDAATLPPGTGGIPATQDFLPGALTDCAVATVVYSSTVAYDSTKFPRGAPTTLADFFDLKKFPGKRAMKRGAKVNVEMALMADHVPASNVYSVLATPEGLKRAFAKLDTLKSQVVWYDANAESARLLADGEVVMAIGTQNRFFNAAIDEGKPFKIIWDGQVYDYGVFVIPKGATHLADAKKYLSFATDTNSLARIATILPFGPARKSSMPLVHLYKDGKTDIRPYMPTNPENMKNALQQSYEFWVDHDGELTERFNAWLAAK